MLLVLLAIGAAGVASAAFAAASCDIYLGPFEKAYFDTDLYTRNRCGNNVCGMAQKLQEAVPGFDLSKANVLLLYSNTGGQLRVMHTRRGPYAWNYHVVLELDDRWILDLDSEKSSEIYTKREYFEKMLLFQDARTQALLNFTGVTSLNNKKILANVRFRRIPAAEFLRDFTMDPTNTEKKLWYAYAYSPAAKQEHPPQTIASYLGGAWARDFLAKFSASPAEFSDLSATGNWETTHKHDLLETISLTEGELKYTLVFRSASVRIEKKNSVDEIFGEEMYDYESALTFLRKLASHLRGNEGLQAEVAAMMLHRASRLDDH